MVLKLATLNSYGVQGFLVHALNAPRDPGWVDSLSGPVMPSKVPIETHSGLGSAPVVRAGVGMEPTPENLVEYLFQVKNQPFFSELRISRDELLYNLTGQVERKITELVKRWDHHWIKLAIASLVANENCYDQGQLFRTTHGESGVNQSNAIQVTGVASGIPTSVKAEEGLFEAIKTARKFTDDQGELMNSAEEQFVIIAPEEYRKPLVPVLGANGQTTIVDGSVSRQSYIQLVSGSSFDVVYDGRLGTTPGASYMYIGVKNGRAFVRQAVGELKLTKQAEGSDLEHRTGGHEHKVIHDRKLAPADWKSIVRVEFAT